MGALKGVLGDDRRVIVGPETGDDAGVFLHDGRSWVATTDFITPVCDDPRRFGRVAAANSISDVYAMGGRPLFALNVCCFPKKLPPEMLAEIIAGGAELVRDCGAAIIGGHTVMDEDLKYGLAVTGVIDEGAPLTLAGAKPGDVLVLTKPLGTGVLINAYRKQRIDDDGFEAALSLMEQTNAVASRLAVQHGATACTDVTGFGLARHLYGILRSSAVGARLKLSEFPIHENFFELVRDGVKTASTAPNADSVAAVLQVDDSIEADRRTVLFDPQTSGGLLIAVPESSASALISSLKDEGRTAARIGGLLEGEPKIFVDP